MSKSDARGCCLCFKSARSASPVQERVSPCKEKLIEENGLHEAKEPEINNSTTDKNIAKPVEQNGLQSPVSESVSSQHVSPVTSDLNADASDVDFVIVKNTIPVSSDCSSESPSEATTDLDIDSLLAEAKAALKREDLTPEMESQLSSLVARLEAVTNRLEATANKGLLSGAPSDTVAPFVVEYDNIVNGSLKSFLDAADKIGGDVQAQGLLVRDAFKAQREFLVIASKSKSPAQDVLVKLLEPTSKKIQEIEEFASKNRRSDFFNHLSGIASSVPALGWVTISPTPGPFVKEMTDSGLFYLNRVLKDFKEKDQSHVDWTRAWGSILSDLQKYIKQYHTTGLTWNAQGVEACAAAASTTAASGGPPPPPPPPPGPPPPPDLLTSGIAKPDSSQDSRNALFADLSKGEDVTKGLKKVTDDMKTHKNPKLKVQGPQPYKPAVSPKPGPKGYSSTIKTHAPVHPPKLALENKKWVVEYQQGNKNLVISETDNKQTVYIYKCENSTIIVKGKVNSIAMDGCKKTAIVLDDVISSVDFVNCHSVQAQVNGKVLTINIDKTDGCMIYLSQESVTANIITAKSSELNMLVPDNNGEFKEFALPEQYRSVWSGTKFITEATDVIG